MGAYGMEGRNFNALYFCDFPKRFESISDKFKTVFSCDVHVFRNELASYNVSAVFG